MPHRIVLCAVLLLLAQACLATEEIGVIDGAVVNARLIVLQSDGNFAVWSVGSWNRDDPLAQALNDRRHTAVAASASRLWSADESTIYSWDQKGSSWKIAGRLRRSDLQAIVATKSDLLQVYPQEVVSTLHRRRYRVPYLGGQLKIRSLRVLTTHSHGETVWFGTGQGEWGGHLVALNTSTGEWSSHYDSLHYATGITQSAQAGVIVSWSMSHFIASCLIRTHSQDARPTHSFDEWDNCYFQSVAYSVFDRKLYAIEKNSLAEIVEGEPKGIVDLGDLSYDPEPDAIGVAPTAIRILPIAADTLVILHRHSRPLLYSQKTLSRL